MNIGPMQQGAVRVTLAQVEAAKIPLPVMSLTITITAEMVDGVLKLKAQCA